MQAVNPEVEALAWKMFAGLLWVTCFIKETHWNMATYVYETIPQNPRKKPRQFEVQQSMTEAALTHCPTTGEPVRRVLIGGSIITRGTSILSMNRPKRRG
jgi:predicted nucleic acid-binding Zn ribbon protein